MGTPVQTSGTGIQPTVITATEATTMGPYSGAQGSLVGYPVYAPKYKALLRVTVWISMSVQTPTGSTATLRLEVPDFNGNMSKGEVSVDSDNVKSVGATFILQANAEAQLRAFIDVTDPNSTGDPVQYSYQIVVEEL